MQNGLPSTPGVSHDYLPTICKPPCPVEQGKTDGAEAPLKLSEIWAIRTRLQLTASTRDLALFNLAIDSKLRACDLIRLRVQDVSVGNQVGMRATVMQQKTHRPVQFEITGQTRECLQA